MSEVLTLLTSAFAGGATGLIGHVVKAWTAHRSEKNQIRILELQNAHELEVLDREGDNAARVAAIESDSAQAVAAQHSLQASFAHDRAAYSGGQQLGGFAAGLLAVVDFVRGVTRPGITWGSCGVLAYVTVMAGELAHRNQALEALVYIATVATAWWFADRPKKTGR